MKIYTKSGDKGETSLIGGERVSKTDPRVEAYGTADELSAQIAMLRDMLAAGGIDQFDKRLTEILGDLMTAEAIFAIGKGGEGSVADITPKQIAAIESEIDTLSAQVKPIAHFTLPGGNMVISQSHICRTVCRRAEREAYRAVEKMQLSDNTLIYKNALTYLNRLSDYFYILGRRLASMLGIDEIIWEQ